MDCGRTEKVLCWPGAERPAALGVEDVRGIFLERGSVLRLRMSDTDTAEAWPRWRSEDQSGEGIISVGPIRTPFG